MGYTTDFWGTVSVVPPLNQAEADYLATFNETRHMVRENGPYFVDGQRFSPYDAADIVDANRSDSSQPGLWCQWIPTDDLAGIEWDQGEKFYASAEWMKWIIDHLLKPGAHAATSDNPQFEQFTFDHVCNGAIEAQGEDSDDRWRLRVNDNAVYVDDKFHYAESPNPI